MGEDIFLSETGITFWCMLEGEEVGEGGAHLRPADN